MKHLLTSLLLLYTLTGWGQLNDSVIMYVDFEDSEVGKYLLNQAWHDFAFDSTTQLHHSWGLDDEYGGYDSTLIDTMPVFGKVMKAQFPFSEFSVDGGFEWIPDFKNDFTELYFSYDIYLKPGFEFADGGKLPGAFEGGIDMDIPTGGTYDPSWGHASTCMWMGNGRGISYIYYPDMSSSYGEAQYFYDGFYFRSGEWFNFTIRQVMNTGIGNSDGVYEVFVNGQKVLEKSGIRWKQNANDNLEQLTFHAFFGGATECTHQTWRREYMLIDNVCLWMPDTTGGDVPQGAELWGDNDIIPIPYTDVSLTGWDTLTLPEKNWPNTITWTDSADYIIYYDSIAPYLASSAAEINIEVPGADSIQLYFTSYYSEGECGKYDYLDIRETNSGGTLVESMYGVTYDFPKIVNVDGNDVYLKFTSDGGLQGSGLRMYYWAYEDGAMMDSTLYKAYTTGETPEEEPDEPGCLTDSMIVTSYTTGQDYYAESYDNHQVAQTFTVSDTTVIYGVKTYIQKVGDPGTVTYNIYNISSGEPTGTSLSSGSVGSAEIDTAYSWLWVDMSEVTLDSGQYILVQTSPGDTVGDRCNWGADTYDGAYSGGQMVYYFFSEWNQYPEWDLLFEIWGAIPCASTASEYLLYDKGQRKLDDKGRVATFY